MPSASRPARPWMRPARPAAAERCRSAFLGLGAMALTWPAIFIRPACSGGVWNRTRDKATSLAAELGCAAPETPARTRPLKRRSGCMCVSADQDVLDLVQAMSSGLRAGQLVIDCSTVGAGTARTVAARLAGAGVEFMDCPCERRHGGRARRHSRHHVRRFTGELRAAPQPLLSALGRTVAHFRPPWAPVRLPRPPTRSCCAGIIEAVGEGHGLRQGTRSAAGETGGDLRQRRRIQLVLRAPRTPT